MRWRTALILVFTVAALCVPTFAVASLPDPTGVIAVYDGVGDEPVLDHSPGLLPAVPILPVPAGARVEALPSARPAISRAADPSASRAPPLT